MINTMAHSLTAQCQACVWTVTYKLQILQKIWFTFKIDSVIILAQIKDKDLKEAKYMDSCDSHGRTIYNGGTVLDYFQVSVYAS